MQNALAKNLKLDYLKALPGDICWMVAGSLIRECAVVSLQEATTAVDGPQSSPLQTRHKVKLSQDIYARYFHVEGVRYVQALSNQLFPQAKGQVRVFKAQKGRTIPNIYVRYDHLGIRGIWFTLPSDALLRSLDASEAWWTELGNHDGILKVTAYTDVSTLNRKLESHASTCQGLKLRRLLDTSPPNRRTLLAPSYNYPRPGLSCTVKNIKIYETPSAVTRPLRMKFIECNKPGIEGYSVGLCGFHISKLCAHYTGAKTPFYDELDKVSNVTLWIHMPIDQDEYLMELWMIWHRGPGCVALIVRFLRRS